MNSIVKMSFNEVKRLFDLLREFSVKICKIFLHVAEGMEYGCTAFMSFVFYLKVFFS